MRSLLLVVVAVSVYACDRPTSPSPVTSGPPLPVSDDPATAQIITSDLAHFWAAYDANGKTGSASAFQTQYLDAASAGLTDFVRLRSITAANLAATVTKFPAYFAGIRANNLALATNGAIVAKIRANYSVIKTLYPPAVFPAVTFLIGQFGTGGTVSANGLLIGTEFYSMSATTPLGELGTFQRVNVKPVDSLPIIVAHEHAHALQTHAGGLMLRPNKNLLEQSLIEGGADFIGEQSSGGNINARLWTFAIPREAALWQEFKAAMHRTDVSRWLYNQRSSTDTPDHPGDLGYFIGYRIAESYYQQRTDKAAALKEIIEMIDADDFLARSGYSPVGQLARVTSATRRESFSRGF